MCVRVQILIAAASLIAWMAPGGSTWADEPVAAERVELRAVPAAELALPKSLAEARSRARLLFELAHGSLQVMHRDFFDDEKAHAIPSASLDDVFAEMKSSFDVEMKWLNAGTDIVNTDHQPRGDFEVQAAKRIQRGESAVEQSVDGKYQYVGAIRLRSQCLKCHIKDRKSTEDRFAALLIQMRLEK